MKAAVLHGPGDLRYEETKTPRIGENDVLVKVRACGICGSDIPRVMEKGKSYFYPLIPGHEFSGEAVNLGKKTRGVKIGDRATVIPIVPCRRCEECRKKSYFHCRKYGYLGSRSNGGFAEYVRVPAVNVVKLPPKITFEQAAFTEPLTVAFHVLNRVDLKKGESIAVFGLGAIGNLIGQLAVHLGAGSVFGIDVDKQKIRIAEQSGLKSPINGKEKDAVEEILKRGKGKGVDIAIEASGSVSALEQAIRSVKKLGRIGLVGRAEKEIVIPWPTFVSVLRKEISLFGVWGFEPIESWKKCLRIMAEGGIKTEPLITHRIGLAETGDAINKMYQRKGFFNKVLIIPE